MKRTHSLLGSILLAAALLLTTTTAGASDDKSYLMLDKLDQTLNMTGTYDAFFRSRIENLRNILSENSNESDIVKLNFKIAQEYSHVCLDSALLYVGKVKAFAEKKGNRPLLDRADFYQAYYYALAGYYIEAGDILRSCRKELLDEKALIAYHRAARKFYFELSMYSTNSSAALEQANESRRALLRYTEEGSYEWHDLMREEAFCAGDDELQRHHIGEMLKLANEGTNAYATACYYYSTTCPEGSDEQLHWLVKSAISDVVSGTKDYHSLICVANYLFEREDIERAFRYLAEYSLPDAIAYNGKLRPLQISKLLPEIESAYQAKLDHEQHVRMVYLVALCLMLLILFLMMLNISHRNKILMKTRNKLEESKNEIESQNNKLLEMNHQLKELNARMKETDKVKEEYISLFLSILSDNINTTRKYKNHVLRNLRKKNYNGLIEEIEMLPPIDEDINEFYKMFDQTFINMYPDFVERFNELLQPGEAILPKGDDLMAPDHRIFALIKLGISDSSKIAALLHYSTNTIYNYKARIKNKARCDREKFEEKVKNLYSSSIQDA